MTAFLRRALTLLALTLGAATSASSQTRTPNERLARDIFAQLIRINTTHDSGNTTIAAGAMAARLRAAGYPARDVTVVGPRPRNRNLVVRLRGTGARRPVLLLAHLDVVEAKRADWSLDPFTLTERDGFFYGRGTSDIKDGAATLVAAMIRWKQEGFVPDRDLILALTAGEESAADYNGVEWLLANRRDLIDAEFCINTDGGDPFTQNGKRIQRSVQASEKMAVSFRLEVTNPGGHSSLPTRDNAIYHLVDALQRIAGYEFPLDLNEVTRSYFERVANLSSGQVAEDMKAVARPDPDTAAARRLSASPYYNAQLRTTCVATQLEAGHARNALPQLARATVNCRILPDESPEAVRQTLVRLVHDPQVAVTWFEPPTPSPPSRLTSEVMSPIERTTAALWPGVAVIPTMETGATDGVYLRTGGIPTYGVSGVFLDLDDIRAHGRDERIGVQDFYDGVEYVYRLGRELASPD
jgi:acetylornithine deacetylase/succinyl-diaminopimelate desuccinylase-like protein